jgi:hypothetical protein
MQDGKTAMPCLSAINLQPTPMPGTNLTLEDVATPEIVVSSPSKTTDHRSGYFAIPTARTSYPSTDEEHVTAEGSRFSEDFETFSNAPWSEIDIARGKGKGKVNCEEKVSGSKRYSTRDTDDDPFSLDVETRKSLEGKSDFVNAYLAREAEGSDGSPPPYNVCSLERCHSGWGRNTGLYDGRDYAASELDESTMSVIQGSKSYKSEASKSVESAREQSETTTSNEHSTNPTSIEGSVSSDHNDERETLQDIIRAYAFTPELEEDEFEINEQVIQEISRRASANALVAKDCSNSTKEQIAADVATSIRVMNRSLGG